LRGRAPFTAKGAKAYLDGVDIEFKEGALRPQMKLKPTEKFKRSELQQIAALSTGRRFRVFGREYKATPQHL
jgi:hypothetical protein